MNYDDVYSGIEKDFKKGKLKSNTSLIIYLVLFFLLLFLIIGIVIKSRPFSFVSDFDNLPSPVSAAISGSSDLKIFGVDLHVDFLEDFDLYGRVIKINGFDGVSDMSSKLSPKNFVFGRGFMGVSGNIDNYDWSREIGDMVVYPALKNGVVISGFDNIVHYYSNFRFVPSTKKISVRLNQIGEGDYVRIRGFIVNIRYIDNSWSWGPSCANRSNGNCSVVYVSDVSWLKKR